MIFMVMMVYKSVMALNASLVLIGMVTKEVYMLVMVVGTAHGVRALVREERSVTMMTERIFMLVVVVPRMS